ncbi:MAG: SHOCT domain-containing protein [Candidatus Yonathbacteria bacterium]|nr:SHOCT domain-containing protein [Candidatus Yonathbacteria bacterium]
MYGYHYLGMGGFGWLGEILWWVLVIAGVVFLVRYLKHSKGWNCSGKRALDILKERYAKGEIDKAEFEAKKKDLS